MRANALRLHPTATSEVNGRVLDRPAVTECNHRDGPAIVEVIETLGHRLLQGDITRELLEVLRGRSAEPVEEIFRVKYQTAIWSLSEVRAALIVCQGESGR